MEPRLRRSCARFLLGRECDVVAFVDDLLALARCTGTLSATAPSHDGLRFVLGTREVIVGVDGARRKLRAICARLAVLASEGTDDSALLYGGRGRLVGDDGAVLLLEHSNRPGDVWLALTRDRGF